MLPSTSTVDHLCIHTREAFGDDHPGCRGSRPTVTVTDITSLLCCESLTGSLSYLADAFRGYPALEGEPQFSKGTSGCEPHEQLKGQTNVSTLFDATLLATVLRSSVLWPFPSGDPGVEKSCDDRLALS